MEQGRFAEAETKARAMLAEAETKAGKESLEAAEALRLIVHARLRGGKGNAGDTRLLAERAARATEQSLGSGALETAEGLALFGHVLVEAGDYPAAITAFQRSLEIRKSALEPGDSRLAGAHYNLANALRDMGEHEAARGHYESALSITQTAEGPESLHAGWIIDRLGYLDEVTGDYASARIRFEQSLRIRERTLGLDHPEVASSRSNLAHLLGLLGEYEEARTLHEAALRIRTEKLGEEHLDTAQSLDHLAMILFELGDPREARSMSERALQIRRDVLGPRHPQVGTSLHRLAELLERSGELDRARALYLEALDVWRGSVGTSHADYAWTLDGLAGLLASSGDTAEAMRLYQEALPIWEEAKGRDHPDVARTLHGLGDLYGSEGDIARGLAAHRRALEIRTKAFGQSHPLVAESLSHLAELLGRAGDSDAAFESALRAEAASAEHARLTISTLPERQALHYAASRPPARHVALSLTALDPSRSGRTWDAVIRSRALVLDEMAQRHRRAAEAPELQQSLMASRRRLANLIVRGPGAEPLAGYQRLLDLARADTERAERALAKAGPRVDGRGELGGIGLEGVSRTLPPETSLVAYVKFLDYGFQRLEASADRQGGGGTDRREAYAAFVMSSGRREASFILLGPALEVDRLASEWHALVARPPSAARALLLEEVRRMRLSGERLRSRVWDPVASLVTGSRRLIIVPDGALHLVNFSTLPTGTDRYLIEEAPLIQYLTAERDLLQSRRGDDGGRGLLAIGGPSFDDASPLGTFGATEAAGAGSANGTALPILRGGRPACGDFTSMKFTPLPAAALEVDEVAALWERGSRPRPKTAGGANAAPGEVQRLVGAQASEAAFKREAPGHHVLHVATHGFFLSGDCGTPVPGARGIGGMAPSSGGLAAPGRTAPQGENPLHLSGLALAGANMRERARPDQEDGVLTAEEIAAMDLSAAEWVVLSACDTGAGEIRSSEGVFGLRRAFQIASGGTLVMSLWSVQDETARAWMQRFYEARLIEGRATDESLRRASLAGLAKARGKGKEGHPYYWGGFVATGSWH